MAKRKFSGTDRGKGLIEVITMLVSVCGLIIALFSANAAFRANQQSDAAYKLALRAQTPDVAVLHTGTSWIRGVPCQYAVSPPRYGVRLSSSFNIVFHNNGGFPASFTNAEAWYSMSDASGIVDTGFNPTVRYMLIGSVRPRRLTDLNWLNGYVEAYDSSSGSSRLPIDIPPGLSRDVTLAAYWNDPMSSTGYYSDLEAAKEAASLVGRADSSRLIVALTWAFEFGDGKTMINDVTPPTMSADSYPSTPDRLHPQLAELAACQ